MALLIRIALDIVVFASAVLLPWWLTALVVVVVLFYLPHWYEAIAFGFVLDVLFATPFNAFGGFQFVFTLGFALVFGIVEYVKTKIRFYDK